MPKKLLLEQGAPTASDKRQIQDGIEELLWVAALKPNNIGVPAFRDDVREYLEIAVLTATLRDNAKSTRLTELIHRAIPYPVVLVSVQADSRSASLSRTSGGRRAKRARSLSRKCAARLRCDSIRPRNAKTRFSSSLALSGLPRRDLYALYQGWLDRVTALEAATITGANLRYPKAPNAAAAQRDALATHARLQREIASLRARAEKEKQMNRRVELNLAIKRLEGELARAMANL